MGRAPADPYCRRAGSSSHLPTPVFVAIALGSNVGDRQRHLEWAVAELRRFVSDLRVSSFMETDPVPPGPYPRFLNAAVAGYSTDPPHDLLAALLALEAARGRERPFPDAPRTLDLDLILYGDRIIDDPLLRVPHPRFRQRLFVLRPLAAIAPEAVDPETGLTMVELLERAGHGREDGPLAAR
jgi:2-amino-4-hydroxy-6-hydroxymethyldihydropteridine diphosphokinase